MMFKLHLSAPAIVFKRTRYYPDISIAHAYCCLQWILIPIGVIFGGRDSPGWFCMQSEIRALAAATLKTIHSSSLQPLTHKVKLHPVFLTDHITLAQADEDSLNQGVLPDALRSPHHSTFVDDNLMANIRSRIIHTINSSESACYLFFRQQNPSLRNPFISMVKVEEFAHWTQKHLGLDIDTRRMKIILPSIKRKTLLRLLLTD